MNGKFSKAAFGRGSLPVACLLYAGDYVPQRMDWIRDIFDKWSGVKGCSIKYCFTTKNDTEYLLIFGIYGGALCFETLRLLRDGGIKKVFFIGSMGAKQLPIGTLVIPTTVVDRAGIVSVDDPEKENVEIGSESRGKLETVLKALGAEYVAGKIVSVPCVLHGIDHVKNLVKKDDLILGVEMEVSTFYYFSRKEGLESYALLWVSDNRTEDLINKSKLRARAGKRGIRTITEVALQTMK